jgi:Hypothetical glycosyl hydrolase family 15
VKPGLAIAGLLVLAGVAAAIAARRAPERDVAGHLRVAIDSAAARADFRRTAARNDVVILQGTQVGRMRRLKSQNPDLVVLLYQNVGAVAVAAGDGRSSATGVTKQEADRHPQWYLRDRAGAPFTFAAYNWLWAADVGDPSYQRRWADRALSRVRRGGWDGVFVDDANPSIRAHHPPEDVAKYPSDAQYAAAMRSALAAIAARFHDAGKRVIVNVGAWTENSGVVRGWLRLVDGAMDEQFAKSGTVPDQGYVTGARWQAQLSEIRATERAGKTFLGVAHSAADDRDAALYGWATLLLAANGSSHFALHSDYTRELWFPEYDLDIGEPKGREARERSGVHRRRFTNGLVLVNPTTASVPVRFGGGRYTGSGLRAASSAVMGPHTGLVLVEAD